MLKIIASFFLSISFSYALTHIVLLGDPHLPGKNIDKKEQLIETINQQSDVDFVVALGDICSQTGSEEEYAFAKRFFLKLHKPLFLINGNHDYIYTNEPTSEGKFQRASGEEQHIKLARFKATFGLPALYYSMQKENYFLIFLAADDPTHLTQLSPTQLQWFENELQTHSKMPTIVFFHAPLAHTLRAYNKYADTPNFIAQPKEALDALIQANPQILLWVSGHTHTSPKEESFASAVNGYNDHLLNLHNSDLNKETLWTNSLFLENDRMVIRTYDHTQKRWIDALERTVFVPKF
jgi:predicted MPP superfamily phosphohydrolase